MKGNADKIEDLMYYSTSTSVSISTSHNSTETHLNPRKCEHKILNASIIRSHAANSPFYVILPTQFPRVRYDGHGGTPHQQQLHNKWRISVAWICPSRSFITPEHRG